MVADQGDVLINDFLTLKNVLHVPGLFANLISIEKLTIDLIAVWFFTLLTVSFRNRARRRWLIGHDRERVGLYYLETSQGQVKTAKPSPLSFLSNSSETEKNWLYHFCFAHPSFHVLKTMFPLLFKGLVLILLIVMSVWTRKHKRAFPVTNKRTFVPFTLIHSDIWGPSPIPNIASWFVYFIDDYILVTWIFLMKNKAEVSAIFAVFYNMVKTQFGVNIKRFYSDNARNYFNQFLSPYFQERGIIHECSCVSTP